MDDETFELDPVDQAEAPTWDVLAPGVTIGVRRVEWPNRAVRAQRGLGGRRHGGAKVAA
ncbi:MAG: hypothetical protein HY294_16785 [Candidatus Rokubacteria bacterium]|nr:hypothetical protein [Candidatus Rokubacteria bacterium]